MQTEARDVFVDPASDPKHAVPLHPVLQSSAKRIADGIEGLSKAQRAWIEANGFIGVCGSICLLPDSDGKLGRVLVGLGVADSGEPCGPAILNLGRAPSKLPARIYRLAGSGDPYDGALAAIAWGLGAYRYQACKSNPVTERARLILPEDGAARVTEIVKAIHLGRDMINAPANDLGPDEIAQAVVALGAAQGADVTVHRGEDPGFAEAYPLIHAVGKASDRPPRMVDLTWGSTDAPKVTLVGKGIAFDTGGLDLKPAAGMLLMKKDMGGAAVAIAAASMIMALNLRVRLRLLVAAAENSVSGNAFRPGDVIRSRAGITVEIGNTDAEGRLVLADALAVGDADAPDLMITFATLTGAARVALGTDLPAMFSTDAGLSKAISDAGLSCGDPVWELPFWAGYDEQLKSDVGDVCNVSQGGFGGAITAALFLKKFVKSAKSYAHFDLYGWRQGQQALGPRGGEPHTARAVVQAIEEIMKRAV